MPGLEKLVAGAFQALSAAVLVSSKNILPQVVKYKLLRQGQHPDEVAQLNSAKHEPQHAVQLCIAKCKLEKWVCKMDSTQMKLCKAAQLNSAKYKLQQAVQLIFAECESEKQHTRQTAHKSDSTQDRQHPDKAAQLHILTMPNASQMKMCVYTKP